MSAASRTLRAMALAAVTPLLEKNVLKTVAVEVPLVFSMSRVIVLAFAVGMLRQIWRTGVAGWPEATLAMAIVLALPVLAALDRAGDGAVLALARSLVGRFGVGAVGAVGAAPANGAPDCEPWKYDDHRGG